MILHFMRNPSGKLKHVLPIIRVYDGHVSLLMDIGRPARVYACAHCIISTELDIVKRSLCNLCALALGLTLHVFATQCSVMSPNKDETAVHCCDLLYRFFSCLLSENVFHVVSAVQFIAFTIFFG